jgi:hypothetical protein
MISVNLVDLETAVEFVSGGMPSEHQAFISIDSGAIYWVSESSDIDEDVPDDLGESDRYLEVPTKNDLGLGRPLVLRFAAERIPNEQGTVRQFFASRGAYARFKDFRAAHGQLEAWYAFETECTRQALLRWCEAHEIKVDGQRQAGNNGGQDVQ